MADATKKEPGFFARTASRVSKWFREMKSELKKVVWPSGQQLLNNTLIVLGAVVVVGLILFGFDWIASKGIELLGDVF